MLVDTMPIRLAFWLDRPVRLDALPAMPDPEPAAGPAATHAPLRPAVDLETRLMLRDRGWRP